MKFLVLALAIVAISARIPTKAIEAQTLVLVQEGYQVDNVVNLLVALARVTGDNLQTLIDNWAFTEANLLSNIDTITDLVHNQDFTCGGIDETILKTSKNIDRYIQNVKDNEDTIAGNLESLAQKREARCANDLILLNKLRENKHATNLLEFLKAQVSDPSFKYYLQSNSGAFVEIDTHLKKHKETAMIAIAKHHMLSVMFLQADQDEDDDLNYDLTAREDIGSGQVDNDQGQLHLDHYLVDTSDIDVFISQLVGYIESLIDTLHKEKNEAQENAFKAAEDLVDYQDSIEHDNLLLSSYITLYKNHIVDLKVTLEIKTAESLACHDRADHLHAELESAQADYEQRSADYAVARKSLEGTLAALEDVIRLYVDKVVNASAVYKEKIDEELARAHPVEPEAPAPQSAQERADAVEAFEESRQDQLDAQEDADEAAREEEREEAAAERQQEAIEAEQAQREAEAREEAQREAEDNIYVAPLDASDLAKEENDVAQEAAGENIGLDNSGYAEGWDDNSFSSVESDDYVAPAAHVSITVSEETESEHAPSDLSEIIEEEEANWSIHETVPEPPKPSVGTWGGYSGEESSEAYEHVTEVSEESESDDEWFVAESETEEEEAEAEEEWSYHWSEYEVSGEESEFSEAIVGAGGNGGEEQPEEEEEPPIF